MATIELIFGNLIMIVAAYLIGSIIFANIFGKIKKIDLTKVQSKNPGAANIGRNLGVKYGTAVFCLDAFKVVFVMLAGLILAQLSVWASFNFFSYVNLSLVGAAALVGHKYPIWYKFKGGKCFSSFCGFVLFTSNWFILYLIVIYLTIVLISKYISVSSIFTVWTCSIFSFIPGLRYSHYIVDNSIFNEANPWWVCSLILICLAIFVTYNHKENIERLRLGEEKMVNTAKIYAYARKKLKPFMNSKKQAEDVDKKKNPPGKNESKALSPDLKR